MKIRLPCLTPAANIQPDAAQSEIVTAGPVARPPRQTNVLNPASPRADSRPAAASFSLNAEPNAPLPPAGSAANLPRLSKAQVNAAIDRWAQTEGLDSKSGICKFTKDELNAPRSKAIFKKRTQEPTFNFISVGLSSIPPELAQAEALETLLLSGNNLTTFPAEMSQCKSLKCLNLLQNQLTSLPAEMGKAQALEELVLSYNLFTSVPVEISQIKTLKTLRLDRNQLTALPAEMGQLKALESLDLNDNKLTDLPAELGQAHSLKRLSVNNNLLDRIPPELGQAKNLESISFIINRLTSFPAGISQAKNLKRISLYNNALTTFPGEFGQAKALTSLDLNFNRLTSFPAEMSQAESLEVLSLGNNQLRDMPAEIAQLSNLKRLNLRSNRFTHVPRALLDLPTGTEIDLRNNRIPAEEILAVRAALDARRAAGQTAPTVILPPIVGDADDLGVAARNGMNVHETVLTDAFKKRLDAVAKQFPLALQGDANAQNTQLGLIENRLMPAINAYARRARTIQDAPNAEAIQKARAVAALMFAKSRGDAAADNNDFQYSAGHVLGYTFLALEAQWVQTPASQKADAQSNGMTHLIKALQSGSGFCDTRLCEEVMQVIGLPLSAHAQAQPEAVTIAAAPVSNSDAQDAVFAEAKKVLGEMIRESGERLDAAPPGAWRATLAQRIGRNHPNVTPEQMAACVETITSDWPTFHDLVVEQRAAKPYVAS